MPRIRRHLFLNSAAFQTLGQRFPQPSSSASRFSPYPSNHRPHSGCDYNNSVSVYRRTSQVYNSEEYARAPGAGFSTPSGTSPSYRPSSVAPARGGAGLGTSGNLGARGGAGTGLDGHSPPPPVQLGFLCTDCGRRFSTRDELAMHSLERVQREFFCRHPDAYPDSNPEPYAHCDTRDIDVSDESLRDDRNRSPGDADAETLLTSDPPFDDEHLTKAEPPDAHDATSTSMSMTRPKSECVEKPEEVVQSDSERVRHPSLVASGTSPLSSSKHVPPSPTIRSESAGDLPNCPAGAHSKVPRGGGGPAAAREQANPLPPALQNLLATFQNLAALQRLAPLPRGPLIQPTRYPFLGPHGCMPPLPVNGSLFLSHPFLRPTCLSIPSTHGGASAGGLSSLTSTVESREPTHNSSSAATTSIEQLTQTVTTSSSSASASRPQLIPFLLSGSPVPAYYVPDGGATDSFLCLQCSPPARVSRFSHFLQHLPAAVPTPVNGPQQIGDNDGDDAIRDVTGSASRPQLPSCCVIGPSADGEVARRLSHGSSDGTPATCQSQSLKAECSNNAANETSAGEEEEEANAETQEQPPFSAEVYALEAGAPGNMEDGEEEGKGENETRGTGNKEFPFVCPHCRIAFSERLLFQLHAGFTILYYE